MFADNIKIFRTIPSATSCMLLQYDTDSIHVWCAANSVKLNDITRVINFARKSNAINYNYCDIQVKCIQTSLTTS